MRILIYGINFSPELTGIGKYTGEMAGWLASRGHEVRVISAPPYYPDWKVGAGYSPWRYTVEQRDGVGVWRAPLWVPMRPGGAKRLLHLASFAISSLPLLFRHLLWRPDVVWVVAPALFCAPGAWLAARLVGARCWLHIQDFEVDAAFDLGIVRAGWMKSLVLSAESWLMRRFDRVSTISPGMLQKLIGKGVSPGSSILFPNWVDVEMIRPDSQAGVSLRAELGLPGNAKVALYSGNMGEKQGLEYVIEAARLLSDDSDWVFVLCGDGAVRLRLQVAAQGLANVRWLPLQPLAKLNALLNMADVHLLPQKKDAADLVMPSKLTGIFASGKPVIAMAEPGTMVYEAVLGRGVLVPPEDGKALAEAIVNLLDDREQCARMGAAARQFAVQAFERDTILREFEKQLLELR